RRVAADEAQPVVGVAGELFEPPPSPRGACVLLDQADVAERPARGAAGLGFGHPVFTALLGVQFEVDAQFFAQFRFLRGAPQQPPHLAEELLHGASSSSGLSSRAIARANASHFDCAAVSCRRPSGVSRENPARLPLSESCHDAAIQPLASRRCSAGYSDPVSTCRTSSEVRWMWRPIAWPCAGPGSSERRMSRSSVPCSNSTRGVSRAIV